jgi:hydrogenase small subunit
MRCRNTDRSLADSHHRVEESFMSEIVEIPAVWLQGSACSGCVVSLLNSFAPGAASLVLRELTPGTHLSVRFLMTAMAGQGQQVIDVLADEAAADRGKYVLVVEGALPLGDGMFSTLGEADGREVPLPQRAAELARSALAVVAVGTCASFGGIPAGAPNPTEAVSMGELLRREGLDAPLINIPGCPPHPDWIVGSLMAVALYGLEAVAAQLDELGRPRIYFGKLIHETCPRRADFDAGRFAKQFGQPGCLYELGCKGPVTCADCPTRMWNSGTNWCVGAGSPCHGCVEPDFPDRLAPLYRKIDEERLGRFRLLEPAVPGRPGS